MCACRHVYIHVFREHLSQALVDTSIKSAGASVHMSARMPTHMRMVMHMGVDPACPCMSVHLRVAKGTAYAGVLQLVLACK